MPRRKNVYRREIEREIPEQGTDIAFFEETKQAMEVRVARLETGMAWADDPPSVPGTWSGNLKVWEQPNGEVNAKTAFLVYRSHLELDQDIYSGSREDILRRVDGGWKIARRRRSCSTPTSCSRRTSRSSFSAGVETDHELRRRLLT